MGSAAGTSVSCLHDLSRHLEPKFCMKHDWQFPVIPSPAHRQALPNAGHVIMPNGLGLVVGGDNGDLSWPFLTNGLSSLRIIDPFQASYTLGPELPSSRWYPSLLTLADGNILVMGGAQVRRSYGSRARMSTPDPRRCQSCASQLCQSSLIASVSMCMPPQASRTNRQT